MLADLGKDRIFLLASSLGSIFGTQVVRCRPQLFYACIGADQNVGMQRGREEELCEVQDRLRGLGLMKGVKALERIAPDPTGWSPDDFNTVARWSMRSDPEGFRRTMKLLKDAVWYAPGWRLRHIRAFVVGMRTHWGSYFRRLPDTMHGNRAPIVKYRFSFFKVQTMSPAGSAAVGQRERPPAVAVPSHSAVGWAVTLK